MVIQPENRVAALAYFQCGSESTLVGSPTRQCLSNGSWSGTKPLCKRKNSTHFIINIIFTLLIPHGEARCFVNCFQLHMQ